MINPRPAPLVLTDGERARLAAWAHDASAGPLALRARIVLACAAGAPGLTAGPAGARVAGARRDGRGGWSPRLMAAETGMSQSAVSRIWRQAGLSDPGRLDLTRIGDNDRMGNMQAGFPAAGGGRPRAGP